MDDEIVKKYGEKQPLATEIVRFLGQKDITYHQAIEALEDALSHIKRASLEKKL